MVAKTNTINVPSITSFLVGQVTRKASCFTDWINLNGLIIFSVLLLNTVHLMPAFGRLLKGAQSAFQSGYLCAMLTLRLARNILGLILVTASTAPNPEIHALVPKGILLFLVLAVLNAALTQYMERIRVEEGARF